MIEHRMIERMVILMREQAEHLESGAELDLRFIPAVVDFMNFDSRMIHEKYAQVVDGMGGGQLVDISREEGGKWRCRVYGYVYDPMESDQGNVVPPGTPFQDLPEDWVCPVCGAGKDAFEHM